MSARPPPPEHLRPPGGSCGRPFPDEHVLSVFNNADRGRRMALSRSARRQSETARLASGHAVAGAWDLRALARGQRDFSCSRVRNRDERDPKPYRERFAPMLTRGLKAWVSRFRTGARARDDDAKGSFYVNDSMRATLPTSYDFFNRNGQSFSFRYMASTSPRTSTLRRSSRPLNDYHATSLY